MKVLLDENLPHRLRHALGAHEIFTVAYMGWAGVQNGELVKLAESHEFDVLLTADQNLDYQQNRSERRIALVCLTALDWQILVWHLPAIAAGVDRATVGSFEVVECGGFRRSSRGSGW